MNRQERPKNSEPLALSVAWGYAFAVLLMLFIFLILVPDADGPSPWDGEAFRKGILEMFANFRILDELADMGIVRVADVGDGFLNVDLDLVGVSNRKFGWAPFYLAMTFVAMALLLRGIRQRFLTGLFGVPSSVRGQVSSYFFGRGINLFFPFGPGDLGTTKALIEFGCEPKVASAVVFYNRVFEVLAIGMVLLVGFVYLGWEGAVEPFFWAVIIVAAVVSLTRPLGWSSQKTGGFNLFRNIWIAFNGKTLVRAIREMMQQPKFFIGLLLLSVVVLGLEILGYWCIKQAFSSPMDDYVLMKDLRFVHFAIVVSVANITRVIPFTFASIGVYEITSVFMFRVFGEGYLSGTTVTLLDSILINGLTLFFFALGLRSARYPSILETWRSFFARSLTGEQ
ncbi:MAG: lysylphosphatidylglycerol synthase domain-containing protein [Acidobacteria bacterium]|nr:lysylphosphatidylglycerol synthase domain-containing protein [Acidobacteriota bacterium]